MQIELRTRHRVLALASQRYVQADLAWRAALSAAAQIVPEVSGHGYWMIGEPGSRIRRLYDQRQRALERLDAARSKWTVAKHRLERRRAQERQTVVLLLN